MVFGIFKKIFSRKNSKLKFCKNIHQKTLGYRYADVDDFDFISKCIKAGAQEHHFKFMSKEEISKMIETGKNMPNSVLRILKFNDADVGFLYAGYNIMTSDKKRKKILKGYEINLLYIADDYRKRGIAAKAILELEQEFKEFDINELYVRCEKTHSKGAIALFEKLGYTYFGIYDYEKGKLYYNIYKKSLTT